MNFNIYFIKKGYYSTKPSISPRKWNIIRHFNTNNHFKSKRIVGYVEKINNERNQYGRAKVKHTNNININFNNNRPKRVNIVTGNGNISAMDTYDENASLKTLTLPNLPNIQRVYTVKTPNTPLNSKIKKKNILLDTNSLHQTKISKYFTKNIDKREEFFVQKGEGLLDLIKEGLIELGKAEDEQKTDQLGQDSIGKDKLIQLLIQLIAVNIKKGKSIYIRDVILILNLNLNIPIKYISQYSIRKMVYALYLAVYKYVYICVYVVY